MEQLDPQVKNLASAIKKAETGDSNDPYNQRGASGEFGAYQYMPDTYKQWAKQYIGDENAAPTVENQNKIAYYRISDLKKQGYNPAQIASIWNSDTPDAYKTGFLKSGKPAVGVNDKGVSYDVPGYVNKVSQNYKQISGSQIGQIQNTSQPQLQPIPQEGQPQSVNPNRAEPTFAGKVIRDIAKVPVEAALSVARGTGVGNLLTGGDAYGTGLGLQSKYLGNVEDYISQVENKAGKLAEKQKTGEISKGRAVAGSIAAGVEPGLELATLIPGLGTVEGAAKAVGGQAVKGGVGNILKSVAQGATTGGGLELTSKLSEGQKSQLADVALATAAGGLLQPAAEIGLPNLIKGAKVAKEYTPLIKSISGGEVTPKARQVAQNFINKEVDRVSESLPLSILQNQKNILQKTGSNGFDIWKTHGLLPEQEGNRYATQNIVDALQPYIEKGQQVIGKYAQQETNLFNVDDSINNVLSYIDKSNIDIGRKNKIAQDLVELVNRNVTPYVRQTKEGGRMVDAEGLMNLKRILYNEAGLAEDLVGAGKAQKIIDSPYFKLAQEVNANIDKNASLPNFKKANKVFSDYLSAEMLAKRLNGKVAKSSEGLVGKIMRRSIFTGGGGAIGNIPGAFIGNLAGESLDRFYTDPAFRTKLFKQILDKGGIEDKLGRYSKELRQNILKRGTTKAKIPVKQESILDRFKYVPPEEQPQDIGQGFILESGKVRKK